MKLYLLENQARHCAILETCGLLERNEESDKVDRLVCGNHPPELDSPLKVRIHYRAAKPQPLPDFCRGTYVSFVSDQGKAIIERHFGDCVQFLPTEIIGFGVDNGRSWSPAVIGDSPFCNIPRYHVMHITRIGEVIDTDRSMIIRDSIGELPELLPAGQFQRIVFKQGAEVPPLFALPYHANFPVASSAFVNVARREKLRGFKAVEAFDTDAECVLDCEIPCEEGGLVPLKEALAIALHGAKHSPVKAA